MDAIVTLYEREPVASSTLPPILAVAYGGGLTIPDAPNDTRPYVIANFVQTVDGVANYDTPGSSGGGSISGGSEPDHMTMGILRAQADAVIFGSGSLRQEHGHLHIPSTIYPAFADQYTALRQSRGCIEPEPISVVVSASGDIDLTEATFQQPNLRALIATTDAGATHLATQDLPDAVEVFVVPSDATGAGGGVAPGPLLEILRREYGIRLALHEGGPKLFAAFLAANVIDELFLTVAPQFAGRVATSQRPALLDGYAFTPTDAPWADLLSIKHAGSHIFLRYRFAGLLAAGADAGMR